MKTYSVCTIDGIWHTVKATKLTVSDGVVTFWGGMGKIAALFPLESIMALLVTESDDEAKT